MVQSAGEPPYEFNRSLGPDAEQEAIRIWISLYPRVDEADLKLKGAYLAVVEPRSTLNLDNRYLGPWQGGALHTAPMGMALDALQTVRRLLEAGSGPETETEREPIPMASIYSLLRTAIENAALAVYLLAPEDRDVRLVRSYQVADDDARLRCSYATEMGSQLAPTTRARAKAYIRQAAARRPSLGDPKLLKLGKVAYSDLVDEAHRVLVADKAASNPRWEMQSLKAWWQILSGMSHGKFWAVQEMLDRNSAIPDADGQGAWVHVVASPVSLALAFERAVEVLECALRLYGRRSKAAWALPEDAAEPRN
jgi:hypothetical protein